MVNTFVALLRGINVGGRRKVPMAQLRALLEGLGYGEVRTYLQSGNAVFTADAAEADAVRRELEPAIEAEFGFAVPCVVVDGRYLRAVVEACPFPAAELEGKQLHATFLSRQPDEARLAGLDPADFAPEDFRVGDRVLYLYAPEGLGRSKLGEALHRPSVLKGVDWTSRNWNSVTALLELTGEQGRPSP